MKDSLNDIQSDIIIQQKINDANNSNSYLNLDNLTRVLKEEAVSKKLGIPFFLRPPAHGRSDRKIGDKENINLDQFNDNIRTIKNDITTLMQAVGMIDTKTTMLNKAVTRTTSMLTSAIAFVDMKYREHRKQVGIYRFTHREEMSDISGFDLDNSSVDIDTNKRTIQANKSNLFSGNIQIGVMSSHNLEAISDEVSVLSVDNNFYKIYVPSNSDTSTMVITKPNRERTSGTIAATFTDIADLYINTLVVSTAHSTPTETYIDIISEGETVTVVNGEYLGNAVYTFSFPEIKADRIIMRMSQQMETSINEDNMRLYMYKINFISPEYTNFVQDATFITKGIDVEFPITDVSIESVDHRPLDTSIDYFISTDKENWIPITPKNISPNAPNAIINIGTTSIESIEYVRSYDSLPWSILTPNDDFGNITLYNILENSNSNYIVSGQLNIVIDEDANSEIIEDSISVYRGIDDYAIETLKYEVNIEAQNVLYRFIPPDITGSIDDTDYIHDIISTDAFVRIENEGHIVDSTGKITLNYPPCNNNMLILNSVDNTKINVASYTGNNITLAGAATATKVTITYYTLLTTIENQDNVLIEIDPESIKYKHNETDEEYSLGNDISYSPFDKQFYVNTTNSLPSNENGWLTAFISFSYKKKARTEYKVFRTYVYYDTETEITILPFTQEEIFAGNFHIIDGEIVSNSTSKIVAGGWHVVITTQPFKTDPNNSLDLNLLTNKHSNAGIILGNYIERRAYNKSMRLVSTHMLSNVIAPNDRDAFTYSNGKIYTNYIPEYLPDRALNPNSSTHLTGTDILAKEAVYETDGKYTFNSYMHKPEKFLVEYNTRPKEDSVNDIRTIYVKGTLETNKEEHTSPTIFKFDVLFY